MKYNLYFNEHALWSNGERRVTSMKRFRISQTLVMGVSPNLPYLFLPPSAFQHAVMPYLEIRRLLFLYYQLSFVYNKHESPER